MLSVNDAPETRAAFGAFAIETLETKYTIAGGEPQDVSEILVSGPPGREYKPRADLLSAVE